MSISSGAGPGRPGQRIARSRGDRGSASLEMVIVVPAVILIMTVVLQGAMYLHARNVAMAAAEQGVRTARADGSSTSAGETATRRFLAQAGAGRLIDGVAVSASGTARQITITVSGRSAAVIPFLPPLNISQSATGTREAWTNGSTG
jgi:Flp pilus assembly protein TadG